MLFWHGTVGVACQNEDQRKSEDTRGPETDEDAQLFGTGEWWGTERRHRNNLASFEDFNSVLKKIQWP